MTGYRAITRARKIVFWIVAVLFLFTWPLLIFYAFGFVISPTGNEPVVKTGVIRVDSFPGGAHIFLNGKDTGKTTPAALDRLKAGTYHIVLRKSGYFNWQGRVAVDIQAVRRVNSAVLVRRVAKMRMVAIGSYLSEQMSSDSQFLFFSGTGVSDLRVFDLKTGRYLPRSTSFAPYLRDRAGRLSLPRWGNIALLHVTHAGKGAVLVLHVGTLGVDLEHVVDAPFFQDVDFAWSPTLSGSVYFIRKDALWRMASWSSSSETLLARMVRSVGVVDNTLSYVDSNGSFGRITAFGRRRVLFTLPVSIRERLGTGSTIEFAEDNWGVVLTHEGVLVIFNERRAWEYRNIQGLSVDKRRDRFLVWSDSRVGSLAFPSAGRRRTRFGSINWEPPPPADRSITSVTAAAGMSNYLYLNNGTIYVETVLPGVVSPPQRVLTLAPGEHYRYSDATGMLVVTDPMIGRMRMIRLVVRPLLAALE